MTRQITFHPEKMYDHPHHQNETASLGRLPPTGSHLPRFPAVNTSASTSAKICHGEIESTRPLPKLTGQLDSCGET